MDLFETIEAMKNGHKITHRLFNTGEYAYLDGLTVCYEDGASHSLNEFIAIRQDDHWNKDWEILN
jgi:hypothetical protein